MTQSPATLEAARWGGRTVLVTGAEGFIGSTLVDRLVEHGASVRAFVHYKPYAERGNLAKYLGVPDSAVTVRAGDLRDGGQLIDAVAGCDTVFHLGALIGIPYSYEAPDSYVQTNVGGTLNVAEACRRHGARLIHTSTSETYGTARTVAIDETHPLQAQSPYAASKVAADKLVESYHLSFGVPAVTLCPFNTFGPRQSARAVIPTVITQLAAGASTLTLGALTPTRDFTFVENCVEANIRAALVQNPEALGQLYNIAVGDRTSLVEMYDILRQEAGSDLAPKFGPDRPGDIRDSLADISKANRLLGYQPQVRIREGLRKTLEWFKANQEFIQERN